MARWRRDIVLRQFRFLGVLILINIGLPLAIYYLFKLFTTQLIALICSGVPPLLRVFYTAFRYHVVDFISVICVLSFVISAALSVITGDIRATLLRDSFTTLIIGFAFLVTLIPLRIRWISIYPKVHMIIQQMYAGTLLSRGSISTTSSTVSRHPIGCGKTCAFIVFLPIF
ncbi:hypothetical protein BX666DRAFT_1991214 [Dichotomocladium elegans]|nr:hypothetical protein BX666DRAFT_1991214 [Dichotomocladium elegans]